MFFDWDTADLRGRVPWGIAAARSVHEGRLTRVQVRGYTDTSGTASYNQDLSARRAQAVARAWVRDDVSPSIIAISGYGETNLLAPTGPAVREPQNRREEIIPRWVRGLGGTVVDRALW